MTGKILIFSGVLLIVAGVLFLAGVKLFSWFGNLPGDIKIVKPGFAFYFPVTSLIVINIILYLLFGLFKKLF